MISKWNTYPVFCLLLILGLGNFTPSPGVSALLDGGDFIAEIPEDEGVLVGTKNKHEVCPVVDWRDVLVIKDICPANDKETEVETVEHEDKLAGIEELETEDVIDGDDSSQADPHPDKTDPLPLTIHPLGLNVAPLINSQNGATKDDPAIEVGKDEVKTEPKSVVEQLEILSEHKTVEEVKDSEQAEVPVIVKEHKPYIVKATPKDVVPTVVEVEETVKEVVETVKEVEQEVAKVETEEEKYPPSESSVEEELLEHPAETEDIIAPFSQWAEKKLVEEALLKDATKKENEPETESNGAPSHPITNPSPVKTNGIKLTKNFASPDCSAKIMGANLESQGSGNVITASRDEYFLNKCTDQAWFVVELCESIKALKIQIANFELYSSSPNQFRISIGNVFPGREKDWMEFGTFSYLDERNIQTFKSEVGVVGKYAKVEILSHHGSEHYCPVSMFKVFGISEIDLITEDDPDDGQDDAPEETVDDELSEHIIVKTIKEAVHKVVNVFRPQNVSLVATLNTSSLQGASLRFRLRPEAGQKQDQEVVNRYHMIYYLLATQYNTVRQYTRIMGLHNLLPLMCNQFGVQIVESSTAVGNGTVEHNTSSCAPPPLPWQFAKFVRVVHGEDFLVALCNVVSMELGQSRLVEGGRVGDKVNTTIMAKSGENGTVVVDKVAENLINDAKVVTDKEKENIVKDIPIKVMKENDPPVAGQPDKVPHPDPPSDLKSEPSSIPQSQPEPAASKSGPAASSVKPVSTVTVLNTANQAGQTTWQKLSNRIKALERNVTLSTGFLEELSLKYIKQIEELNNAVKGANDAISGVSKREEVARERGEQLVSQVKQLNQNLDQLVVRVGELQEEVLARHGLLLLLEVLVIGLVFLLCRPGGGGRVVGNKAAGSVVDRRRSLDTIRGEREKTSMKLEKRRSSIEVGCLPNGQLGSMVTEGAVLGLSKKQRKRKRRKDSKLGLRNVVEEMESDDSKVGASLYDTFHGAEQRRVRVVDHRKRSRSWSEQQQEDQSYLSQASVMESSVANTSASLESPSRFAVDQVWELEGGPYKEVNTGYVEDMMGQDCVFAQSYEDTHGRQMYPGTLPDQRTRWAQDRDMCEDRQSQYMMYQDRRYVSRLIEDVPQHSNHIPRRPHIGCLSHTRASNCPPAPPLPTPRSPDTCKSVWFPGRSRKSSVIRVSAHSQGMNGHPVPPAVPGRLEVSNIYTMLDHSVHETSACETEPEGEERMWRLGQGQGLTNGRQTGSSGGNTSKQKSGRSKSSSPNRQANLLMRRQREAIRKFQPDQAEWLHKKRDS